MMDSSTLSNSESPHNDKHYVQYPYRYVVMVTFFTVSIANAIMWITCSPISDLLEHVQESSFEKSQKYYEFSKTYEIDIRLVSAASLSYMVIFVILNFPANYVLDEVLLGTTLTIIGAWCRIFINESFYWVLLGQVFGALGQPFILNAPAKIATYWFIPDHRPLALAGLALINVVGVGIGFVFPSFFTQKSDMDQGNQEEAKDHLWNMMFYQSIILTVICLPTYFLFKEKPPTPPSEGAQTEKIHFRSAISQLMREQNFWLLFCAFACILGNFNTIATLITQYINPYNYDDDDSSLFGAIFIISGIIGAAFASIYVEKTFNYQGTFRVCSLLSIFAYGFMIISLEFLNIYATCISIFLIGFITTPLIPLSQDFGCEIAFPIGEAMLAGIIISGGQITGVIQILVCGQLINSNQDGTPEDQQNAIRLCNYIALVEIALGFIFYELVQNDMRRHKKEMHEVTNGENDQSMKSVHHLSKQSAE